MLFERIRGVVKTKTSVIYITHRLAELRQIAQRVTVLRDGGRGVGLVDEIGDSELLGMIVGRDGWRDWHLRPNRMTDQKK